MAEAVSSHGEGVVSGSSRNLVPHGGTAGLRDRARWWLAACVGLALCVRLVHTYHTASVPFARHLIGDAAGYYAWAQEILSGGLIGKEAFYQAPLYPYVLAFAMAIFGEGVGQLRLLQALGGVVAVGMLYQACSWSFNGRVGLVAGVMLGLYGPAIFFDGIIQKASLGCLLLCALLWGLTWGDRARKPIAGGAVGIAVGLLVLTRENAMVWLLLLAVWVWVSWRGTGIRARASALVLYVVGAAFVLIPVGVRNAAVAGEWSVSTFQAGPNFYIGNSREADGRYRPLIRGHESPAFERRDATELAQRALGRELSAGEVSDYWMSRALGDIAADRVGWLRLMGLKMLMVWNAYEVSDVESLHVYAEYSPLVRWLSRVWHFGVLCPLAGVGVVLTREKWRQLWVFYVLILSMACSVALFYVLSRYRFPLVPLLIPFAAAGVVGVWELLRARDYVRLIVPVVVAALVAVMVNIRVHDEGRLNALGFMNLGVALAQEGDVEAATGYFQRAVSDHPGSAEGQYNLAQALALQGHYAGAIPHYEAALALEPALIGADYNFGVALERAHRLEEALQHYARAVELDPADAEARRAVGRLRQRR